MQIASTGQVARLLDTAEPRLNDIIRRKKLHPVPTVTCGRRQWTRDHVLAVASVMKALTDEVRARIDSFFRDDEARVDA